MRRRQQARTTRHLASAAAALACLFAAGAGAQDDDPLFAAEPEPAASALVWYGDFLLRGDSVHGLAGRDDVERARARGRVGLRWSGESIELGAALEASAGTDDNRDNRRNNDNERSDDAGLDEAWLRWQPREGTSLLFGKSVFPLSLTPLTWDADLRPFGASVDHSFQVGELDRLQLIAGVFRGDHLYGDDSRIAALQAAWRIREGAQTSGEVLLSFLDFGDLDRAAREGLTRTNRRRATPAGPVLVSDYRLLDLQLALRSELGDWPLDLRLDLVRNLGADDLRDGARFSAVLGTSTRAHGWELGYAVQRIQRDAVMAAFNEDDWWFHSFARGSMPWVAYGFDEVWSVRAAGFIERRDGQPDRVERILLDLRARW